MGVFGRDLSQSAVDNIILCFQEAVTSSCLAQLAIARARGMEFTIHLLARLRRTQGGKPAYNSLVAYLPKAMSSPTLLVLQASRYALSGQINYPRNQYVIIGNKPSSRRGHTNYVWT